MIGIKRSLLNTNKYNIKKEGGFLVKKKVVKKIDENLLRNTICILALVGIQHKYRVDRSMSNIPNSPLCYLLLFLFYTRLRQQRTALNSR